tara:strand:- start:456 stop:3830 length:3375 start_codon:yes stop_codon:yes gene_type:complete
MDLFNYQNQNIKNHFQRSIRIDNDLTKEFLDHFIFHATGKKVLNQITSSINNSNQCAFTLTGPYGTGKSSLALFLQALLSNNNKIKNQAIQIANFSKTSGFSKLFLKKKWFIVKIIGSKDDPLESLARTIDLTIKEKWISKGIPSALKTRTKPKIESIIEKFKILTEELEKKNYALLILADEMGKFLDYSSSVGSDLNLFQEVAENFSNLKLKKKGLPVFAGILHQPFEEYASNLGRSVQEDWQKVQGRFEDIPFSINAEESINLISSAINSKHKAFPEARKNCEVLAKAISGKKDNILTQGLIKAYPLHPIVTLLLGPISKQRFGQNERSIFTFLNSGESFGFLSFINDHKTKPKSVYTPDLLFDYLSNNLEPSILASNLGHAWSEASEAIRRAETLDDAECIRLAKSITLIDLFGKNISLNASKEILATCLSSKSNITKKLQELEKKKVAIFRKFKKAYALFSGSDIDLDDLTNINKQKIVDDHEIILSQLPSLTPTIAKKHFHETGTQRLFQKFCIVLSTVKKAVEDIVRLDIAKISAGSFIYVIKNNADSKKEFDDKFAELTKIKFPKPTILGFSEGISEFVTYALEIASLKRVRTTVNAIEGDAVAKKELKGRLNAYQNLLINSLQNNFEQAEWHFKGLKVKKSNLSTIASSVCSQVFHQTPILHNELINREKLSTSAVLGSLNLIMRIFNSSDKENLGMEAHPAEFGMYLSLIKKNNLHVKTKDGYQLLKPAKDNIGLHQLYNLFNDYLKNKKEPVSLQEIFNIFSAQPYGVKTGILPLLVGLFYKINEGSFALYNIDESGRESLITEHTQQIVEKFYQLPEDIKIMHVKIEGEKQEVLNSFKYYVEQNYLKKKIKNPTPLNVLKPLVLRAYNLPTFAKKTRTFKNKKVMMLRDELLSTQNPYELLYKKIPDICGEKDPDKLVSVFKSIFDELDQVYKNMIENMKKTILDVFKTDPNISDIDFNTVKDWAEQVGENDPFSSRFKEFDSDEEWIEQIISYLLAKPANEWTDNDYNQAVLKVEDMVRHFIMSYRLYNLRQKHSDTKIIDIAIFEGKKPTRSSKFYKFDPKNNSSVEKITTEVLSLLNREEISESEKGEIVLNVLKKIMKFENIKNKKDTA